MSERDDFLAWVGSELAGAEKALHDGDATGWRAIWSGEEPVTILGARKSVVGRADLDVLLSWLEQRFSDCESFTYEVIAAEVIGDLAYTVGYEHTQATVEGDPSTYSLRVTQIYRRESGRWRLVHRHGSAPPDQA